MGRRHTLVFLRDYEDHIRRIKNRLDGRTHLLKPENAQHIDEASSNLHWACFYLEKARKAMAKIDLPKGRKSSK